MHENKQFDSILKSFTACNLASQNVISCSCDLNKYCSQALVVLKVTESLAVVENHQIFNQRSVLSLCQLYELVRIAKTDFFGTELI